MAQRPQARLCRLIASASLPEAVRRACLYKEQRLPGGTPLAMDCDE